MSIGRTYQPELERIRADLIFEFQTELERRPSILVLQHPVFFRDTARRIALVPILEVGELILRRQHRMRLAVALDLGNFIDRFPATSGFRIAPVDRRPFEGLDREHRSVRPVTVMRDRQDLAIRLFLVGGQIAPQILGIFGIEHRVGQYLRGAFGAVAEDDHAMQVVALRNGAPLKSDEGGEPSGVVEVIRGRHKAMPYRAFDFFVIDELFSLGHAFEEFPKRAVGLLGPGPEALVQGLAIGIGKQRGIACVQQDGKAHVLRMVRYNQKVQRAEQLDARATASRNLFSACEPECRVRTQCVADETCVR